jgi:hypothetical protein
LIPASLRGDNAGPLKRRGHYKNVAFVSHPHIVG